VAAWRALGFWFQPLSRASGSGLEGQFMAGRRRRRRM